MRTRVGPRCGLSRALRAAQDGAPYGVAVARRAALAELDDEALDVDYLEIRTPGLGEVGEGASPPTEARVLVAARVGGTRLIDNLPLTLGGAG